MLLALLRPHDVEGPLAAAEAVLDERAKDPVLLVSRVEQRANVTMPPESAAGKLHRMIVGCHLQPPRRIRPAFAMESSCERSPPAASVHR